MSIDAAFDRFSDDIGPDPIFHLFARLQRDRFTELLTPAAEINEVLHTGSLAHGTASPVPRDVDLVAVMPKHLLAGRSPQEAIELTQRLIRARVYGRAEDDPGLFGDTRLGDHVVQCDWHNLPLGPFEGLIPEPPPVDVMPAYRDSSGLHVPERSSGEWKVTDPELMTRLVRERQLEWEHFDDVVRMVRQWNEHHHLGLKSVAVEMLVLTHMPHPAPFQTLTRAEALAQFFENAHRDLSPIRAPGTGYLIDPDYLYGDLREALAAAAEGSRAAVEMADRGATWLAEEHWQEIFGDAFGPGWLIGILRWIWGQQQPDTEADRRAGWPEPDLISPAWPGTFDENHPRASRNRSTTQGPRGFRSGETDRPGTSGGPSTGGPSTGGASPRRPRSRTSRFFAGDAIGQVPTTGFSPLFG